MKLWKIMLAMLVAVLMISAVAMADDTHEHKLNDVLQIVRTSDLTKSSGDTHYYTALITRGCSGCGEVYGTKEEFVTAACDYKAGQWYEATCTAPAYRLDKCACGNTKKLEGTSAELAAKGHNHVMTKIDNGNCKTLCTYADKCTRCGDVMGFPYTLPNAYGDHVWSESKDPATCVDGGWVYKTCTVANCGATEDKYIEPRGYHRWDYAKTQVVAPTCTNKGYSKVPCMDCGYVSGKTEMHDEVAALGHQLTKHDAVEAKCSQVGNSKYYTCDRCAKIFADAGATVELDAIPYIPVNSNAHEVKEGGWNYHYDSCTSDKNYREAMCMICHKYIMEYLPAGSHNYIDPAKLSGYIAGYELIVGGKTHGYVVERSYCDKAGKAILTCTVCSKQTTTVAIPVTPHKLSDWEFPNGLGDCLNPMISVRYCVNTNCNYKETKVLEEATGHDWKVVEGSNTATCDKAGTCSRVCNNCGVAQSKIETPALGHKYTEKVTAATCTKDGKVVKTCSVCGDKQTEKIPAAHGATKEVAGKAPACGVAGTIDVICTVCDAKVGEKATAALSHSYSWIVVTKPSEAGNGRNEYKCGLCGDVAEVKTIKFSKMYYNNTMTSFGPMTKELVGGNDWYRVTPVDLTVDGVYTYDLIASNKYIVGKVTITVNAGTLTVSYSTKGNVDVKDEALLIYASKADLATGTAVTAPVGAAINAAETFGADSKVLVSLILTGDYDAAGKGLVDASAAAGMIANID